jgi:NADH:ubiquinone oxidoreductase subunit F (NADH-binding)
LGAIIDALTELQHEHGHLRGQDLEALAARLGVPLYRIEGLVSFYPHFRREPPPRVEVVLCRDVSCRLAGGSDFCARARSALAGVPGVAVREVSCIGRCDTAPAAAVNEHPVHAKDLAALAARASEAPAAAITEGPAPTRRWASDPYGSEDERYGVLASLRQNGASAETIIQTLKDSGLRGMGGAGFPTGLKWDVVRKEPAGAEEGIVFIRHEYGPERARLARAIDEARGRGALGKDALGKDMPFDVRIAVSPGGYILGEETARLECLEDRRGEPRNKPPFPGQRGLYGKPTLLNNVETLSYVPIILKEGPEAWKARGVRGATGLKFIALSGDVERPGVYQVPMGTTIGELVATAGGTREGKPILAIASGGASSNFLHADAVDAPLDFKALAERGSMLGSGAVLVVAEGGDIVDLAANIVAFFRNESCGKCVPCRVGTDKAVAMLERAVAGSGSKRHLALLPELAETLAETSICGLGHVAIAPFLSVMRTFEGEVRARFTEE